MKQEQILVRITGQDRPGLTASIMGILAKYDAQILDIGLRLISTQRSPLVS